MCLFSNSYYYRLKYYLLTFLKSFVLELPGAVEFDLTKFKPSGIFKAPGNFPVKTFGLTDGVVSGLLILTSPSLFPSLFGSNEFLIWGVFIKPSGIFNAPGNFPV